MTTLCVDGFSVSLDGYGPARIRTSTTVLVDAVFACRSGSCRRARSRRTRASMDLATWGVDNDFAARGFDNIGAAIMDPNAFGPIRLAWTDDSWTGLVAPALFQAP
jgi:hypothetical protein